MLGREGPGGKGWEGRVWLPHHQRMQNSSFGRAQLQIFVYQVLEKAEQKAELELPYKATCPGGALVTTETAPSSGLPIPAASTKITINIL